MITSGYNTLNIKSLKYYKGLFTPGMMTYFDILPRDIVDYIYRIRDDYYANKIIKNWYSHIAKKIVAIELLITMHVEIVYRRNNVSMPLSTIFSQANINRIKYIYRNITGVENLWWRDMLEKISINFIYFNIYNDLSIPEKNTYNTIINMISKTLTKYHGL